MEHEVDQAIVDDYYRRMKRKENLCFSIALLALLVWGSDIAFDLGLLNTGVIEIAAFSILASVLILMVTECPSCKRYAFRSRKCSACQFPLVKPRQ